MGMHAKGELNWDLSHIEKQKWKTKETKNQSTTGRRSRLTKILGCRYRWRRRPFQRQTWAGWGRPSCERRWRERRQRRMKRGSIATTKLRSKGESEPSRLDPPLASDERETERVNEEDRERESVDRGTLGNVMCMFMRFETRFNH